MLYRRVYKCSYWQFDVKSQSARSRNGLENLLWTHCLEPDFWQRHSHSDLVLNIRLQNVPRNRHLLLTDTSKCADFSVYCVFCVLKEQSPGFNSFSIDILKWGRTGLNWKAHVQSKMRYLSKSAHVEMASPLPQTLVYFVPESSCFCISFSR